MAKELLDRAITAEPAEARAALEAAVRAANDRIWVSRNAARIYRERFGDLAAARRVLDQLTPLTCIEWRLVAAAWVEVGEPARATACLERAAANARTAVDQCTVALGYRDVGFADEGRLLITGADVIVHRALDYWTVATAFEAFGDRDGAVLVLERGLRDATDVAEIVTFAYALASFDAADDRVLDTLARAERRASTVDGWLGIAMAYDQLAFDHNAAAGVCTAAVRCVAAASKLSISSHHERAIAVTKAWVARLELLDDDRPRLTPAQVVRAGARSIGWERDANRLLGWIRARIPRTSLDAMTGAGRYFVDDGLRTLLELQKSGTYPHPLPAYLDGLAEIAQGRGAGVELLPRAFALTLLCIEEAAVRSPGGREWMLVELLEHCIRLGDGAVEAALPLFAALADAYDATFARTTASYHVLFAELALVLAAAWLDPADPRIAGTIDRMVRDEPGQRERLGSAGSAWLFGLAPPDPRAMLWVESARGILVPDRHRALLDRIVTVR
jgi:hypothetical protein